MEDEGSGSMWTLGDGYIASNALPQASHCLSARKFFSAGDPVRSRFQWEIRTLGTHPLSIADLQIQKNQSDLATLDLVSLPF